jgi:sterol desaturase/sphingolipid hydroxylase (fatty acid hydroxylase superfamily)
MLPAILSIIAYDIWFYISHVILHDREVYKYHKQHHEKPIPQFLDTYHSHWIESPFQSLGFFVPMGFLAYSAKDILTALIILNIRGMLRHDERGVYLIGNHHLLHHLHASYNFGEYWLDSLGGTLYPKQEEYRYGLLYL